MKSTSTDRAVSPVVGIALLVAITLTIAAVLGGATSGFVTQEEKPSSAVFSTAYCNDPKHGDMLEITHQAGEFIDPDNLVVTYDGVVHVNEEGRTSFDGSTELGGPTAPSRLGAGDTIFMSNPDRNVQFEDASISVIWKSTDQTFTLTTWETAQPAINQSGSCSVPAEAAFAMSLQPPAPGDCDGDDHDRGHGNECDNEDDPDNPGRGPGNGASPGKYLSALATTQRAVTMH